MRNLFLTLTTSMFLLGGTLWSCEKSQAATEENIGKKAIVDSLSYAIGMDIGMSLINNGMNLEKDDVIAGIKDVLEGNSKLTQQQAVALFQKAQEAQMKEFEDEANENMEKGKAFLAENAKRPEVKKTASGIQYEVLTPGSGRTPSKGDIVTVHYTGKLIDGTVFDSSIERGEPTTFGVMEVIPGWREALQMMNEGAKWRIYIPSDLAYGARGAGGVIGPNETLIFEVELIKIGDK